MAPPVAQTRPFDRSLLATSDRAQIPVLYAQDHLDDEAIAYVRLFVPWGAGTWYVTEFDGADTCFGVVDLHETELGYFSLREFEHIRGPGGLRIERDLAFVPKTLRECRIDLARRSSHRVEVTP